MRVSYNILKEYIKDFDLSPEELNDLFPRLGIEVESYTYLAEGLSDYVKCAVIRELQNLDDIGHYKRVGLSLGNGDLTVVSTAPNLKVGMKVPVALPGARLQGVLISEREIRGIKSQGNILSYTELGIPLDSSGVIELPDNFEVGISPLSYLGIDDWVYDLYVFPNRPDLLGVLGIAIEICAHLNKHIIWPKFGVEETIKEMHQVRVEDLESCPVYSARVVRGIKVQDSPYELKIKLIKLGQRPINNIVDITNYVMFELGQPIHAFDETKIDGSIVVRKAKRGERIACLDGVDRELNEEVLLIADETKPLAIAGIIGGEESSVNSNTENIVIESAYFDKIRIRKAVLSLNVNTESSRRFERGGDPNIVEMASKRVAYLVKELAGGEVGVINIQKARTFEARKIYLPTKDLNRLFGMEVGEQEVKRILERYGFSAHPREGGFDVLVPTRRRDIEVWEDLAEEILKVLGYDSVKGEIKTCGSFVGKKLKTKDRILKRVIEKLGFFEVKSIEFVSPNELKLFGWDEREFVRVKNPLNMELSVLRTSLLPCLLKIASLNLRRGVENVRIFEIGKVFRWRGEKELPKEELILGVLCAGEIPQSWDSPERKVDIYDILSVFDALYDSCEGIFEVVPADLKGMGIEGGARIIYDGLDVGFIGGVLPKVRKYFDIKAPVFVMELKIDPLILREVRFRGIPQFPPTSRDISVVVGDRESISIILHIAKESFGPLLEDYRVIDIYKGKPIPEGYKSVTIKFIFRASDRTLTQEEVDGIFNDFLEKIKQKGFQIRGLDA